MLSAKQRDSNLLSYDELPPYTQRSISMGKSSSSRKSSETENSLPIPVHTRAASTPAHIETPRHEATVHSHHRRYPSCVETSPRKETKKFSTDSYMRPADDRYNKRALSESKEKITKRNASSPAAISLLSTANEKLHRYNTDDRGKSPIKQNTLPIKASPELLAQLLAGSSEKMTTAERERNKKQLHVDAYALPMAVQQFLVSVCAIFTIYSVLTLTHPFRLEFDFVGIWSQCEAKPEKRYEAYLNLQLENKYRLLNVCENKYDLLYNVAKRLRKIITSAKHSVWCLVFGVAVAVAVAVVVNDSILM